MAEDQTVSDYLLQRLREWGVELVFGYPGDGINGILASFGRADNQPRFIQARHEEMAAFQACGYAKFTGRVGVCTATSGPGGIHLLNGLYDAKLDHTPVVAIVGQQPRTSMGSHMQQEVDLASLYKDVAGDYVTTVNVPQQLPEVIDRAMRVAAARKSVTAVIVPYDVQELAYSPPQHEFKQVLSGLGFAAGGPAPADEDLDRAATVLNDCERVAILAGAGARDALDELTEVAETLGAGAAKALVGYDVLPDDLPWVTGSIGLLGTKPSWELMRNCDALLWVGSSFPYVQFLPDFDQARGVQIDTDPGMLSIRYPMEVNLLGDTRHTLRALLPRLRRKTDRSWRQRLEREKSEWRETIERRAMTEAHPLSPLRVFHELSPKLPDNAIVTTDSGSSANWFARYLRFRKGMRGSVSGTLATMGCGVPYAIGAKFGNPDRVVVACVGDGAMQMNGMNELITIGRYWRSWADPRLVVLVLHNNDLNQVTWEMRAMTGIPKFEAAQVLPDFDYAGYAELVGLKAVRMEKAADVGPGWDEALTADRPVVVDAITDPEVPPIPPHASFEQVESAAKAVLQGDPNAFRVVTQGLKEKVQEFIPGRK
ncbi:MAG: thiamine pyrophosphate-requiring protein [Actinomycetota bacterium]|nr:thiamine pyrophosphate-requiring protein [Actinomycetota bacterium]